MNYTGFDKERHFDGFSFYRGDCMDLLKQTPDKYYDLCIVDPPYGIGECGDKNGSRGKLAKAKNYKAFAGNDLKAPDKEFFDELFRISKNQIIFGANHFISNIPYDSSCWIVWDKLNGDSDFADCELAWTSFTTSVRRFSFRWAGMLQGNMKDKQIRIHPTEKPIALYSWLIQKYAKKGDKILDTHLGSASIALAIDKANKADGMELDFVGIELDKYYFDSAMKRFSEGRQQMFLNLNVE